MLVIGLTGGIGSGKSLTAQFFADLGAQVIDADDLARRAIERGSDGFNEVIAAFGDSILKDGDIDRRELAKRIFSDPSRREVLEGIIHPKVKESFERAIKFLSSDDVLVYEIPLLAESGSTERFNVTITVEAPMEKRIERLKKKGLYQSDIESRISAQATSEERREIADIVIENDGTPEDLLRKVEKIWIDTIQEIKRQKT